jgi:hypothetical protein
MSDTGHRPRRSDPFIDHRTRLIVILSTKRQYLLSANINDVCHPAGDASALASCGLSPVLGLEISTPCTRPIERFGDIVAYLILGGLHHRYARI